MNTNTVAIAAITGFVCVVIICRAERRDVPRVAKSLATVAVALLPTE
ncbi:hypothetical protein [Streptomyces nitrosporeus]